MEVQGDGVPMSDNDDQPIALSLQCCSPKVLALQWDLLVQVEAGLDSARQQDWLNCSDLTTGLSELEEKVV